MGIFEQTLNKICRRKRKKMTPRWHKKYLKMVHDPYWKEKNMRFTKHYKMRNKKW